MSIITNLVDFVYIVDENKKSAGMTGVLIKDSDGEYKTLVRAAAVSNIVGKQITGNFVHIRVLEQYGFKVKPIEDFVNPYIQRTIMIKKKRGVETLPLKGRVFILDPGHGGHNENVSPLDKNYKEKDFVLKTALALKPMLEAQGAKVYLTRDKDIYLSLTERTKIVENIGKKEKITSVISIHTNAGGGTGVETIYSIYQGKKLAEILAKEMCKEFNMPLRRVFTRKLENGKDYYGIIRGHYADYAKKYLTVITECGFHDNKTDLAKLMKPDAHSKYATSIARGLVSMYGN